MYTTKRKFQKLLSSLTSSKSSLTTPLKSGTMSASTDELDGTAKRRRFILSTSRAASTRPKTAQETRSSKHGEQTSQTASGLGERRWANYAPWDRTQFLERLKTFRHVDKWSAKPSKMNEVRWAKRGWSCIAKETVACVGGCGKEVFISMGAGEEEASEASGEEDALSVTIVEEELADRYAEMMATEHDMECMWRTRGCDDAIQHLPLNDPSKATAGLRSRYSSLVDMGYDLTVNTCFPDDVDIEAIVATLPSDFLESSSEDSAGGIPAPTNPSLNREALALAVFGWEAETGHIDGLVTCGACFRRLGLWLFQRSPSSQEPDPDLARTTASLASLDFVGEHRDYCPWIDPAAQRARVASKGTDPESPNLLPGWRTLLRTLCTVQHFRDRLAATVALEPYEPPGAAPSTEVVEGGGPDDPKKSALSQQEVNSLEAEQDEERWAKVKALKKAFEFKRVRKQRPLSGVRNIEK